MQIQRQSRRKKGCTLSYCSQTVIVWKQLKAHLKSGDTDDGRLLEQLRSPWNEINRKKFPFSSIYSLTYIYKTLLSLKTTKPLRLIIKQYLEL